MVELCKDSEYRMDRTTNTRDANKLEKIAKSLRKLGIYLMLQRTHDIDVQFLKMVNLVWLRRILSGTHRLRISQAVSFPGSYA